MAHASAHVSPCATRAQHGARRVAADAAGSGAGGLPPRGHSRPHRVAPCSPPALRTRCAAPLLRTLSTPCGVHGAARRVSGGISRRRTAASATSESAAPSAADVKQGRILLGVVGASYGSLAAALRFVFLLPGPPAASALSAVRGVMAAICFLPLAWHWRKQWADLPPAFWAAACELALWNFLSQGLLNIALIYTDAMRVSFIAQTAIVLTPVISALRGNKIPKTTWLACFVALVGVGLLAGDTSTAAAAAATVAPAAFRITGGDALALGGAATSSLYIYRISEFGKQGLSTDLTQAVKVILLGFLYTFWAVADGARIVAGGGTWLQLWPGYTSVLAWAVLLYSAVVPGAVADVLQARGQAKVDAAEAQVLLGAEPLWTAVLGMVFLRERLGPQGWTGAGLIISAVLLAGGVADAIFGRKRRAAAAAAALGVLP